MTLDVDPVVNENDMGMHQDAVLPRRSQVSAS